MHAEDYEEAEKAFREHDVPRIQALAKKADRNALYWLIPGILCLLIVGLSPALFLFGALYVGGEQMLLLIAALIFSTAMCFRKASAWKSKAESMRVALRLKQYLEEK